MLPLRHAPLWRLLSVLLLILVLAAMLAPPGWLSSGSSVLSWFAHGDKLLHGLTFIVLATWFAGFFERRRYLALAVWLTVFGLVGEACQFLVGYRTADWLDIAANSLGILLGLGIALAGLGGWGLWFENRYSRRTQH
ncbi:MAG: VanZ family protein [Gammaproteobacteria bacterium]|nr:VanZ family protein [Gammaproteobacteria bacterium]MBT8104633.1 VanZ family protein [Gammaproteobacteria bacterium]NNF49022.1 VanZ family protein [Woeseiaceae bacterium]NNK24647.1 VanZ family protein [Woeseiaceae bacterium]NNL62513.1 VanZ family protein [Woeseiaceae bacterium]